MCYNPVGHAGVTMKAVVAVVNWEGGAAMGLRSLAVALAGVFLALTFPSSAAPSSANMEADLTVSHTVTPPSRVDVNTGFSVPVSVSFLHLGPSEEVAPAVFSYTLTGPPECTPFSKGPSDTSISFGSTPGLGFAAPSFCTTTGVKTFESRAEFLPGTGVTDADLTNNVSVITFDVEVSPFDPNENTDSDGVGDSADNRPSVPNANQMPDTGGEPAMPERGIGEGWLPASVAAVSVGTAALATGGWFARRRWLR